MTAEPRSEPSKRNCTEETVAPDEGTAVAATVIVLVTVAEAVGDVIATVPVAGRNVRSIVVYGSTSVPVDLLRLAL